MNLGVRSKSFWMSGLGLGVTPAFSTASGNLSEAAVAKTTYVEVIFFILGRVRDFIEHMIEACAGSLSVQK